MGRRIASQVHHQVSRLMRGNLISEAPKWYQPVLDFPPLPLPPKAPPARTAYDQKMKPVGEKLRRPKNRPLPIHYLEDDIRRQFYLDHPFEAFRPTTLVEKGDIMLHEVQGKGWTRLRQRGRNPNPEDAIQFALTLHQKHAIPLSQAYARSIAQFRALRSEHHIATTFAVMEAEALGGTFVRGEIEHAFEKEKRAVATWEKLEELDEGQLIARKRWKMIAERHVGETDWSQGGQYVKMWREGIRVNYSPALTNPVEDEGEEDESDEEDSDDDEERLIEERDRMMEEERLIEDLEDSERSVDEPTTDVGEGTTDEGEGTTDLQEPNTDSEEIRPPFEDMTGILTKQELLHLVQERVWDADADEYSEFEQDEEYDEEYEEDGNAEPQPEESEVEAETDEDGGKGAESELEDYPPSNSTKK
ncbi:mitochondrial ribosomal protein S25-domain-containing protein [Mycena rosella]|uniref:Small ribosomal subunit protein mS23 n=1 Tax=Mycena rosella TaxID=1033263 RepID=A0AAD7D2A9_MYCRO|nr:mitochondrial ribosomal protein S25-domain-containing protein [Mycena rosella]